MRYLTCTIIAALLFVNWAFGQTTFDPLAIGVGARAMGMGKTYVAVAEEADTIFTNPAGLGEIDAFQFSSMSATLFEEVQYIQLGGVYPLGKKSAFGIGFVSANVSGIELRDAEGNFLNPANPSPGGYGNSVLFLSFGRKFINKFSLGLSLKYFSQSVTGTMDGDGSGINLDFGFLHQDLAFFSWGAVARNILTANKILYDNGNKESLPAVLKIGTRMHLLGKQYQAAFYYPEEVVIVADLDLSLNNPKPTIFHLGVEYSPITELILRTGIDQDYKSEGVQNNLTLGVSLKYAGLGFHYAYHPYGESGSNNTHYFSISFDERGWPYQGFPDVFFGSVNKPANG